MKYNFKLRNYINYIILFIIIFNNVVRMLNFADESFIKWVGTILLWNGLRNLYEDYFRRIIIVVVSYDFFFCRMGCVMALCKCSISPTILLIEIIKKEEKKKDTLKNIKKGKNKKRKGT